MPLPPRLTARRHPPLKTVNRRERAEWLSKVPTALNLSKYGNPFRRAKAALRARQRRGKPLHPIDTNNEYESV